MAGVQESHQPPSGPPPSWKSATDSNNQSMVAQIRLQGWNVLNLGKHPHNTFGDDQTYAKHPEVWPAIDNLFQASKAFFALPDVEKQKFLTRDGSEEGYSSIKSEKEFITLRRNDAAHCPETLRRAAEEAWEAVFTIMNEGLRGIESNLGLPSSSLTKFSEPCLRLANTPTATMMRLFKYENDAAKVVAEPHMDLGLLSLVCGDTPGLEVWDAHAMVDGKPRPPFWNPIEQSFERGMGTIMGGRQLQYFTRGRFMPGGHRVVSYGENTPLIPDDLDMLYPSKSKQLLNKLSFSNKSPAPEKEKFRYSIVFVLRAHEQVSIDYPSLEQPGFTFSENEKEARTAGQVWQRIRGAHFNINTGLKERDEQRKRIDTHRNGNREAAAPKAEVASG